MSEPIQKLLGLLQLARRAREAHSTEVLGFVMVNETLQVLPYRQAALYLGAGGLNPLGHVAAISGLPQPNPAAPYTQWLTRLFHGIFALAEHDVPRTINANELPELMAEWAEWWPAHALWMPLNPGNPSNPTPMGGLLLAADTPWQEHDIAVARELVSAYAHALAGLRPRKRMLDALRGLWASAARRRWLWLALVLVACFPVQQSVLAPAEVVPKDPFLVRAPQDGVVERVLVQPNQAVAQGTPLFSLDQTALQTRLAIAGKAYDTAQEEFRQSAQIAVTEDKGKLDMSLRRGVMGEKSVELAYVTELLGRVQVRAERAGIAVFSDVNDWQGKTVQLGERVLTLADPAKVELNIQLPVGERFDVAPGAEVTLYPNASPLSAYSAVVTQVAYSAEPTRDGQVAYRLKANFKADEPTLRIGLMGTAKLHGTRVPLLYYALRRPLTTLRQWLGL